MFWHMLLNPADDDRRETQHTPAKWMSEEAFEQKLLDEIWYTKVGGELSKKVETRLRAIVKNAVATWTQCAGRLMTDNPELLDNLLCPVMPQSSNMRVGDCVEISWPPGSKDSWWPAQIAAVHDCGTSYVVKYGKGEWREERGVPRDRLRCIVAGG